MSYWPLFRDYIADLYHGMPLWVYVAALCIVVAGGVTLVATMGWKRGRYFSDNHPGISAITTHLS